MTCCDSTPPPDRPDPRTRPDPEQPLIERLITAEIRGWIDTQLGLCEASEDTEDGRKALDRARHVHLNGVSYRLTPRIVDALRRAGLVAEETR